MSQRSQAPVEVDRYGRRLFALVLIAGLALRAWQFLANHALWIDELALANGLLSGTFGQLFDGPGDFVQVAPPGFLVVEWALGRAVPGSDLMLRLPAFLSGCACLVATWFAAREAVGERDAWIAPGLLAVSGPLIFAGAQVKPYAADAFVAALLVALALRDRRLRSATSRRPLGLAGLVAPWFSFPAVFLLGAVALTWFVSALRDRIRPTRSDWTWIALWAASGAAVVLLSGRLLDDSGREWMHGYWEFAFAPVPPSSLSELLWPIRVVLEILWSELGFRLVSAFGALVAFGAFAAWRRQYTLALLLVAPFLAAVGASALRQYPFGARLAYWSVPLLALLLNVAMAPLASALRRRARHSALMTLPGALLLAVPLATLAGSPPSWAPDDIGPIVRHLQASRLPGDLVYVHTGAWHAWHRYGRRAAGDSLDVRLGSCPRDYPRGTLREFDTLRGSRRVWFLFARAQEGETAFFRRYLDHIGIVQDSLVVDPPRSDITTSVELYRYDLGDPGRLAAPGADAFTIPDSAQTRLDGCRYWDPMLRRGDGTRVVELK